MKKIIKFYNRQKFFWNDQKKEMWLIIFGESDLCEMNCDLSLNFNTQKMFKTFFQDKKIKLNFWFIVP